MSDYDPDLIASPSLGTITHQAEMLRLRLHEITEEEYSTEACHIRDLFLAINDSVLHNLSTLADSETPAEMAVRLRSLGSIVQALYSYLEYIDAASLIHAPPGIQLALTELVDRYFPSKVNGEPICVIHPQWTYNLQFVHLNWYLSHHLNLRVLDPDDEWDADDTDDILDVLWKHRFPDTERPRQLAVLSFAGLDTRDSLSFAVLAHELAHFIDFSYIKYSFPGLAPSDPPLHMRGGLAHISAHIEKDIRDVFSIRGLTPGDEEVSRRLHALRDHTTVCIRELLADLAATRMLGFGFFAAQTSFLKTVSSWSQPAVIQQGSPPGYPGIGFRAITVLRHLTNPNQALKLVSFLEGYLDSDHKAHAERLLGFLSSWKAHLDKLNQDAIPQFDDRRPVGYELLKIPERVVKVVMSDIVEAARIAVPDELCARLTPTFFRRIDRMRYDLPPIESEEPESCFHEVLSAAWAYQVLHGEPSEVAADGPAERTALRSKSSRLLLKAIELIPTARVRQEKEEATGG